MKLQARSSVDDEGLCEGICKSRVLGGHFLVCKKYSRRLPHVQQADEAE